MDTKSYGKAPQNLAIVGGGRTCKFFLKLFSLNAFTRFKIKVVGVCDTNPEAEGYRMARDMGIYTTTDLRELLQIEDLNAVIESTNSREVLYDLIKLRPERVGILELNIARWLLQFVAVDQKRRPLEQQVLFEKMISEFLIQQVTQRILVLNTDFTIAEANAACLESIQKTRKDVIGAPCYSVIRGFNAPCASTDFGLTCPMLETIRTGRSSRVIEPDLKADDPLSYSEIVTYPIKDPNGDIVRIIEIWRDISRDISSQWIQRQKESKADLDKLIQEDRLISLGKLVASCVHEINNPIQGLITFSHIILDILKEGKIGPEDAEQLRKFAELMSTELERCGAIVSGLLSFSRESSMEYRDTNLNDVLTAVLNLTRHRIKLQDIELKVELAPDMLSIHGDANKLQQCFLNLIFNSIEAMPSGGRLEIISRLDPKLESVSVEIHDTGVGISPENLDHIFDPFFTTKPMGEGTGLGLSIVYGVVKSHGGKVAVNSRVNEGTNFILQFPIPTGDWITLPHQEDAP
ncbi:MAG: PAS domain-containing protein [Deltaproteobacteria bacterium]|nr:PAS domain-containing protein [Deltaproteobacteria bacterium]